MDSLNNENKIEFQTVEELMMASAPTMVVDGRIALEGKPTVEKVKKVLGV